MNLNDFDTSKLLFKTFALLHWRPSWLSNAIGDPSSHILKLLKTISLLLIVLEQLGYPGIGPCLKFRSILSILLAWCCHLVVGGFHFQELKQYQTQQVYSLILRNILLHCKVRYRSFPLSLALQSVVSFENSSRRIQKDFVPQDPQVHRRLLWTQTERGQRHLLWDTGDRKYQQLWWEMLPSVYFWLGKETAVQDYVIRFTQYQ